MTNLDPHEPEKANEAIEGQRRQTGVRSPGPQGSSTHRVPNHRAHKQTPHEWSPGQDPVGPGFLLRPGNLTPAAEYLQGRGPQQAHDLNHRQDSEVPDVPGDCLSVRSPSARSYGGLAVGAARPPHPAQPQASNVLHTFATSGPDCGSVRGEGASRVPSGTQQRV